MVSWKLKIHIPDFPNNILLDKDIKISDLENVCKYLASFNRDFSKYLRVWRVSIFLALYQAASCHNFLVCILNHISNVHWGTTLFSSSNFTNLNERKHRSQWDWLALLSHIFCIIKKEKNPKVQFLYSYRLHRLPIPFLRQKWRGSRIWKHICTSITYPVVQLCT